MTGLVVWRAIDDSSAPELLQPDIWILMGGAAIATLAGDHIHKAGLESVRPVTVVTWIVATAWIPPLIYVTLQRFRRRRELPPGLWWAAVFPLGMYSAATYATAVETGWRWLTNGVVGVLLDRVRGVAHRGDRIAAAISACSRAERYSSRRSRGSDDGKDPLRVFG